MAFTTANTEALRRSEVWSPQLKEVVRDDVDGQKWVNWITGFPDGDTFTIPSIGEGTVRDYSENQAIVYDALDTGEFQFSITEYISSATYITNKAKQDMYYMSQLTSRFVPYAARAILERLETDIFALAGAGASGGQTGSSTNAINGAAHRFVGTGTSESIAIPDFSRALYSLKKANIPDTNLVAFVDPSVEYVLNNTTNIVNMSNNPRWEGVVTSGLASGRRFVKNIFGFDIYVSNYLPKSQNETINAGPGNLTTAAGVANIFFSASSPDLLPFMGAWRQLPTVESGYNKDFQREEHVTTARYGLKVYRPENLVVVLTDTDIIA